MIYHIIDFIVPMYDGAPVLRLRPRVLKKLQHLIELDNLPYRYPGFDIYRFGLILRDRLQC